MLTRAVKERLSDDVQLWVADGMVSTAVAGTLRERYQASGFGLVTVIKYLGISGGVFCFFGVLGLISAAIGSAGFAGGLVLAVGGALMATGIWLNRDVRNRYAFSSRAVTALGAMAFAGGVAVLCKALNAGDADTAFITGLVALPVYAFLAYRLRDGFLLVLALLAFFQWVGSWTAMFGRSTYEMDIEQPKVMCVAALVVFGVGLWHEQLQQKFLRFFQVYESLALVYLNVSLLILSIYNPHGDTLIWVLVLSGAALAQIVGGARLQNGLVLGFGVTTAAIDLFTRYYEHFWDRMSLGAFLALGGGALVVVGVALERMLQLRNAKAATP